jgi:hypothetical protein
MSLWNDQSAQHSPVPFLLAMLLNSLSSSQLFDVLEIHERSAL